MIFQCVTLYRWHERKNLRPNGKNTTPIWVKLPEADRMISRNFHADRPDEKLLTVIMEDVFLDGRRISPP